ncbi:MAG TPA: hypothetical protein VGD66_14315 [Allosphingosinicella sp.]|jgi:hypothetical protein
MVAKMSEKRVNAFLRAYARSGNMTLSAEQAGMSKSWAVKRRWVDAAFDAACRAAKQASVARLAGSGSNRPPEGWGQRAGVDLVVARGGRRPPQVVRSLRTRWTPRAEARFLGALGQSCNVRIACEEAGMTVSSYEAHRRRWPDFRRRVAEALAIGRVRIEARLEAEAEAGAERLLDLFDRAERLEDDRTYEQVMRLVVRHRQG